MQKYLAEFIGTFFLVLTVGCTGISVGPGVIPQTAIGAVLMAMIYAGGPVSGAHYNPAVTLGVFLRGRCAALDVAPYLPVVKRGIDMIDPPSYTSAWPWVVAKTEHGRRGCGLPQMSCLRPADTRSTSG
jgi:hypothetical protein